MVIFRSEGSEPVIKQKKLSADGDPSTSSSHSNDRPLAELELEELNRKFRSLHFDLVNNGCQENVPELLLMLDVLLEANKLVKQIT